MEKILDHLRAQRDEMVSLLGELARSDRRVGELCALVDKPQNLVSYHLRELRAAGLI